MLWIEKSLFSEKQVRVERGARGGGCFDPASGSADVIVRGTSFTGNEARATGSAEVVGSALRVYVSGSAAATVEDDTFIDNRSISAVGGSILALGRLDSIGSTAFIGAWRNRLLGSDSGTEPQVYLEQSGPGTLVFGDSIVALGTGPAVRAGVAHGTEVFLTNLTLTDNGGVAVEGLGGGTTNLSNTILWDNGGDVSGVVESRNLREDPLFVDPAHRLLLVPPAAGLARDRRRWQRRTRRSRTPGHRPRGAGPGPAGRRRRGRGGSVSGAGTLSRAGLHGAAVRRREHQRVPLRLRADAALLPLRRVARRLDARRARSVRPRSVDPTADPLDDPAGDAGRRVVLDVGRGAPRFAVGTTDMAGAGGAVAEGGQRR
jgi:hypothetical protein